MHTMAPGSEWVGLIGASEPSGGRVAATGQWHLTLFLAAWRQVGHLMTTGELRCELPVTRDELTEWMDRLSAYQQVRFTVATVTERHVELSALQPFASDDELTAVAQRLQAPLFLNTERFGALRLERAYDWYQGVADWQGHQVELTLTCDAPEQADRSLAIAEALYADQLRWTHEVLTCAVKQLLPLKNDDWLETDEAPLTGNQFTARLKLKTLAVRPTGHFTFWFNDGDLFGGHDVTISGTLEKGCTHADIVG